MKIQVLGTAAAEGWPAIFCTCSVCVKARELGGKNIRTRAGTIIDGELLIDFGPDTYMHVLNSGLDLGRAKYLFVTHSHSDHLNAAELFMRTPVFAHLPQDTPPLKVFGNDKVLVFIDKARDAEGAPDEGVNARLEMNEIKLFDTVEVSGYTVKALKALHDRNENCMFFSVEKDGKRVLYGHDTGIFPEESWEAMRGMRFDIVLLDCTTGPFKEGSNHMGIPDNVIVRERMLGEGLADANTRFVMTHFSHNGGMLHDELELKAALLGFGVAYDGVVYEV